MKITIRYTDQHPDPNLGKWRALLLELPVMIFYGETKEEAKRTALARALGALRGSLEGNLTPYEDILSVRFVEEETPEGY